MCFNQSCANGSGGAGSGAKIAPEPQLRSLISSGARNSLGSGANSAPELYLRSQSSSGAQNFSRSGARLAPELKYFLAPEPVQLRSHNSGATLAPELKFFLAPVLIWLRSFEKLQLRSQSSTGAVASRSSGATTSSGAKNAIAPELQPAPEPLWSWLRSCFRNTFLALNSTNNRLGILFHPPHLTLTLLNAQHLFKTISSKEISL